MKKKTHTHTEWDVHAHGKCFAFSVLSGMNLVRFFLPFMRRMCFSDENSYSSHWFLFFFFFFFAISWFLVFRTIFCTRKWNKTSAHMRNRRRLITLPNVTSERGARKKGKEWEQEKKAAHIRYQQPNTERKTAQNDLFHVIKHECNMHVLFNSIYVPFFFSSTFFFLLLLLQAARISSNTPIRIFRLNLRLNSIFHICDDCKRKRERERKW